MKYLHFFQLSALLCLFSLILSGCSGGKKDPAAFSPGKVQVLVPQADGTETIGGEPLILDISHTDQGYFVGTVTDTACRINLQVIGPDGVTYKYFIDETNKPTVFPLTAGNGSYAILAFQNITADQYASLFSQVINVELQNEFLPFLYPNQYVNFSEDNEAVKLAQSLTEDVESDLEALSAIYKYVTENITYDNEKAATVSGHYLPDIDRTLETKTGICFDYASLTAAMLRSVGIPSKLAIGYSSSVKHAWIDVYIQSVGWVEKAVKFSGSEWELMDPTFASTDSDESIQEYIGDGDNYTLEYVR